MRPPQDWAIELRARANSGRAALFFRQKDGADALVWAYRTDTLASVESQIAQHVDDTPIGFIWFDAQGCHAEPLSDQRGMEWRLKELCNDNTVAPEPGID